MVLNNLIINAFNRANGNADSQWLNGALSDCQWRLLIVLHAQSNRTPQSINNAKSSGLSAKCNTSRPCTLVNPAILRPHQQFLPACSKRRLVSAPVGALPRNHMENIENACTSAEDSSVARKIFQEGPFGRFRWEWSIFISFPKCTTLGTV